MSPSLPLIATVILNWNNAGLTIQCAESVLLAYDRAAGQGMTAELVIVDNGSEEADLARLEAWCRKRHSHRVDLVKNSFNLGFAAGMNAGLAGDLIQRASFFWLLNNDTEVSVDAVTRLVDFSTEHPEAAIIGSTVLDQSGREVQSAGGFRYYPWLGYSRPLGAGLSPEQLQARTLPAPDYIDGAVLWLRGEFLRRAGGLPAANFLYYEELYLNLQLLPGEKIAWCRQAVVKHRGGASISSGLRSSRATYYAALSAYRYTAKVHPLFFPTVVLARLVGIGIRALRLREPGLPVAVLQALWTFISGREERAPDPTLGN